MRGMIHGQFKTGWAIVLFSIRPAIRRQAGAHPIRGDELRALRELQRHTGSAYVFETERGTPFTTDAVNRLIKRIKGQCCGPNALIAVVWGSHHASSPAP